MFERGRIDAGDGLHAEGAHLVAQPELERGTNGHRQVRLGQSENRIRTKSVIMAQLTGAAIMALTRSDVC